MAKTYAIWDKTSDVYTPGTDPRITDLTYSTPVGTNRFTAEEWKMLHPAPAGATVVCSAGDINGGFFGILSQMVRMYEAAGVDFSNAITDEDKLDAIEAFEKTGGGDPTESTPEERIAAALELANVIAMPTVNEDDPDED